MEVNIALLIMAVGVMGLLSLFPVGMRQGDAATSDTVGSSFADLVLNAMRANAQTVTNWDDWVTLTNGVLLGVATGSTPPNQITVPTVSSTVNILGEGATHEIVQASSTTDGYLITGQYLQYALHLETVNSSPQIVKAWIQVTNRRYDDVSLAPIYATSFVFMGM